MKRDHLCFPDAFEKTVEKFGKINIVVNNAGIMTKFVDSWEKAIDLNYVRVNKFDDIDGLLTSFKPFPKYSTRMNNVTKWVVKKNRKKVKK